MVKQYKLLKWYPSLPKRWEAGMLVGQGDRTATFADYSPCSSKYGSYRISCFEVQDNPEFWEEIKEKEYEVLSLRLYGIYLTRGYAETTLRSNGLYLNDKDNNKEGLYTLEKSFENGFNIYSIRRISDGEVLTIGDTLVDIKNKNLGSFTLKKIEFEVAPADKGTGKLSFVHDHKVLGKWIPIENLEHSKQPLFITDDGKELYLGDTFYSTSTKYTGNELVVRPYTIDKFFNKYIYKNSFSTKEAAKKWIDENKPKYSKKDILNLVDDTYKYCSKELKDYLKTQRIDFESFCLSTLRNKVENDKT